MVDMCVLLLRDWVEAELGHVRPFRPGPERGAVKEARLLSSYNNNSNNPQRGTDRLRGAW
ncbi:Hpt sensor hybrid histidine kinase [Mycolicibacterium canariasense]|uniref:Hpt sensor hybrid histidine kinase n=1 Tax=Mycolicibacterium canariasense TaxID=228230 RepID=A0A100W9P9_MYCCR|nr:Hpt sensor hybrid histidine kinase [Mycolicibacterium canariasense]